jgi:hypothetical protein
MKPRIGRFHRECGRTAIWHGFFNGEWHGARPYDQHRLHKPTLHNIGALIGPSGPRPPRHRGARESGRRALTGGSSPSSSAHLPRQSRGPGTPDHPDRRGRPQLFGFFRFRRCPLSAADVLPGAVKLRARLATEQMAPESGPRGRVNGLLPGIPPGPADSGGLMARDALAASSVIHLSVRRREITAGSGRPPPL